MARLDRYSASSTARVAAADDDHVLAAIEEAVAGGAGRNAKALKCCSLGDAQPFGLGAGGDDQRIGGVFGAAIGLQPERPHVEVDLGDDVVDDLGADMLGLLQHLLHQPRTLDRVGEARIVLDIGGDHQLAALLQAGDQHRLQHGARRIDRGGIAGRAGADDENRHVSGGHGRSLVVAADGGHAFSRA